VQVRVQTQDQPFRRGVDDAGVPTLFVTPELLSDDALVSLGRALDEPEQRRHWQDGSAAS